MEAGAYFVAGPQLFELMEPDEGPLHHPTGFPQGRAMDDTSAGDLCFLDGRGRPAKVLCEPPLRARTCEPAVDRRTIHLQQSRRARVRRRDHCHQRRTGAPDAVTRRRWSPPTHSSRPTARSGAGPPSTPGTKGPWQTDPPQPQPLAHRAPIPAGPTLPLEYARGTPTRQGSRTPNSRSEQGCYAARPLHEPKIRDQRHHRRERRRRRAVRTAPSYACPRDRSLPATRRRPRTRRREAARCRHSRAGVHDPREHAVRGTGVRGGARARGRR